MKPNKLLIVSMLALPMSLTACGGGSGSSANTATTAGSGSSATTINGISVPPAPDPVINNATLAGVDSNKNGVRDDVDILVATQFGADSNLYSKAIQQAKADELLVTSGPAAYVAAICGKTAEYNKNLDAVTNLTMNTAERKNMQSKMATIVFSKNIETGECTVE